MLHVVGAGLAGLAASVAASQAGWPVTLHEATDHAGGRCRSYFDPALNTTIDNGTHLVMDVNRTAIEFARAVAALKSQLNKARKTSAWKFKNHFARTDMEKKIRLELAKKLADLRDEVASHQDVIDRWKSRPMPPRRKPSHRTPPPSGQSIFDF